jgi:hypothetical protein
MTHRTRSALTDIALRFMTALAFVVFAWSVSEIVEIRSRPNIPVFHRIEPQTPCVPDRSRVKRFAHLGIAI